MADVLEPVVNRVLLTRVPFRSLCPGKEPRRMPTKTSLQIGPHQLA